jgi:hypothetical protein
LGYRTKHSYPVQKLIKSELKNVENLFQQNKIEKGFYLLIGLTLFMRDLNHWYLDTNRPENVIKIMHTLNACWLNAFKYSDSSLGLKNNSQQQLIEILQKYGHEVAYMNDEFQDNIKLYEFKWNWTQQ